MPTREEFERRVHEGEENEYWGVYELEEGRLVAFCMNLVTEHMADYKTLKAIPKYQQMYAYYGLLYEMNRHYLKLRGLQYVTDGSRSITEHSNIQPFLINKLRFRRAYCQLEMHYVWWLWLAVHILLPFRRLFPRGRVRALLKQESMTRSALSPKRKMKKRAALTAKWVFDRVGALLGILLFWWFIMLLIILVRIKMPGGPALFRQKRIGEGGKIFTIVKLRTMTPNHGGSTMTVAGENRITPLGAKLRKYKLDELPQLWNVLVGDMSFVGPRPDVPGYADQLQGPDREVLRLKPGITGPATLKYRDEEELLAGVPDPQHFNDEVIFPDKVRLNRYYLHHYSFCTDMRMIVATLLDQKIDYAGERI
jgi:lipopolysaccharide/colanic/teichoic acid biosynthesis glycosyltransferase